MTVGGKEEISENTFRAKLDNDDHGNWVNEEGSFLRTGDLGFLYNGELFITGRKKDVIIINGKNHYPQDIELTVQECHNSIRPGCICAINHSDEEKGTDSLIILAEIRQQDTSKGLLQEICDTIARVVPGNHGLIVQRIVILKQHSVPKTTSGKLQRSKAKDMLLSGALDKRIITSVGEIVQDPSYKVNSKIPTKKQLVNLESIQGKIVGHVHRVSKLASKLPIEEIDIKANLIATYGFDSLGAVQLTACLKDEFGIEMAPAILLDVPTIFGLSEHISKQLSNVSNDSESEESEDEEPLLSLKEIQQKISEHVHLISKVASKVPKNELNINANLITDYGFDSLAAVQLTASMKQSFGIEVAPALLYDVHTIADLSNHVYKVLLNEKQEKQKLRDIKKKTRKARVASTIQKDGVNELTFEDDGKESPIIVALSPKSAINKHNPPLYCIHPLLGNVASYIFLAKKLGISRPVYGIQAPNDIDDDIKVIAERYVRAILLHQQNQPYYLCGYSYGGLVAWEMAKILQEHGIIVGGIYLIDAPAPLQKCVRDSSSDSEEPHILFNDEIEELLNDADSQWMIRYENEQIEAFKRQIGKLIASMYSYTSTIEAQRFPIHYWRSKDFAAKTSKLLLDHPSFHEPNFGWEHYQGGITFHRSLPGHHYNVLREETAGRLAREFDTNMPIQSRRSSMDLRPLMLEKVATSRGSSPSSSSSGKNSISNFPLFRGTDKSKDLTSLLMNAQIPLPVAIIGMMICMYFYNVVFL